MYQHMILMCSDYDLGKRIAFHKCYSKISDIINFEDITKKVKDEFNNIEFSFHHIPTESRISESIVDYDSYFRDVIFYSDLEKFREHVKTSTKVTPEDIAKYILCKGDFDQLQVQKLLYFAYEEFSRSHDTPLFEESFEAWKYGPVIPDVYKVLNKYGKKKIEIEDKELERVKISLKFDKIKESDIILGIVDEVLCKYGCKTGGELIAKTHCKGSPWSIIKKKSGLNSDIPFESVKRYARELC